MKYLILCSSLFLTILLFVNCSSVSAQALPQDLTNVNVDDLSDGQIKQLIQEGEAKGLSDDQIVQTAESKGLPASQGSKLSRRIAGFRTGNQKTAATGSEVGQPSRALNYRPDSTLSKSPPSHSPIFGADLFRNSNSTFEPHLNLATPVNYIVGPGDQLNVSVYGQSIVNWKLEVSPEGNINLPSGGIINVAGKTIESATAEIRARLIAKNYAIGNGSELKVTLGDIRSISVIMVGEVVKPGTYTLPSLATAFNALYAAGGPNDNGSFRTIEIIRNNRVIRHLDVYDFLVGGDEKDNIGLMDQDIIRVPAYNTRVEIAGEIKTPGLLDVIRFAGGFTSSAYRGLINVSQISDRERRVTDVTENNFKNYIPLPGDKYVVEKILERVANRVIINGAVFRPGQYELQKNMTLSELIDKASGLTEDAFTQNGTITRLNPDNSTELLSFNVADVLNKKSDIALKREDVINIRSVFDLHDKYTVKITGDVRNPGDFPYADSMKVENLILMAGGFTDGASVMRVEVARRVYNSNPAALNSETAKVLSVDVDSTLKANQGKFALKPFDIVLVYSLPGYQKQGIIRVEGEVTYPGSYVIQHKNEKISDIISGAGGLTAAADADGSTLKRSYTALLGSDNNSTDSTEIAREHLARLSQLKQTFKDSVNTTAEVRNNFIGIDLAEILKKPGSVTDLIVKDGDVIRVPQKQQVVQVNGEVHVPGGVVYIDSKTFKQYILNAGGFSDNAAKKGAYIIYPNGSVEGTRNFLFFRSYPKVKPGGEIFIPKKPVRQGFNVTEFVGIITALGTTVILAIIGLRH
jgi:protein involved in polysaccharide export with SLBB domain